MILPHWIDNRLQAQPPMAVLTGSLSTFELQALVRFLTSMGKSGDLLISRDGWIGLISLDAGRLTAAAVDGGFGSQALQFIVVALRGGHFTFTPGPPSLPPDPQLGADRLIELERRAATDGPILTTNLPAPTAIPQLVALATDEEADAGLSRADVRVLLDVNGVRTVRDLAIRQGPLRALRSLSNLSGQGLIRLETAEPGSQPRNREPQLALEARPWPHPWTWRTRSARRVLSIARSEIVRTLVVTAVLILGVRSLVQNFRVEGVSMLPSFAGGQVLLVNRAAYFHLDTRYVFGGPQRGDVAIFRAPPHPDSDYIKRIIGLPGDRILIAEGEVFVNNERLEEPYVRSPAGYTFPTDGIPMTVPDAHYFVLGDNRPDSFDSHLGWLVSVDDLIGRAWIRCWPPNEVGIVQPRINALD
jgi:signal peptidase I